MKKSTRTFLFFSFLLLFVISTPVIIAYSQGYRVDWEQKTIVKTGALFLEPRPAPVEIFINNKLLKRSNFVFQNIFIGNLLPGNYLVRINKDGYSTWTKNLEMLPKLVTEVKNIMLFPIAPESKEIKRGIKKFSLSPSGEHIIFVENNKVPKIILRNKNNNKERLIFKASNGLTNWQVANIQWNKDSTKLLFSLENKSTRTWMMIDITADQPKTTSLSAEINAQKSFKKHTSSLYKPIADNIKWIPSSTSLVFFTAKEASPLSNRLHVNILFSYNAQSKKLSEPLAYDVSEYAQSDKKIFYISSILRSLNFLDLETGNVQQISFNQLGDSNQHIEKVLVEGEKILAIVNDIPENTKSVYRYSKEAQSLEKIWGDIDKVILSNDNKKILFLGDQKIKVYWLEDIHIQPFRDAGDMEDIYESDGTILSAAWFSKDNEHIIFSTESGIKVIELDGRDKRNIHTLSDRTAEDMFYDKDSENLYILSEGNFYSILLK